MKNCRNYIIYKFDYATSMDTPKKSAENRRRSRAFVDFKILMINTYCYQTFEQLVVDKDILFGAMEFGIGYVCDYTGIKILNQWDKVYMAVPRDQIELIKFFEKNKPDYVTKVSKI